MNFVEERKLHDVQNLSNIITAAGGSFNSVEFRENGIEGIGIFASKDIAENDVILSIPYDCCISLKSVQESDLDSVLSDFPGLLDYPDEVLVLALMNAKYNGESKWNDHVRTMPHRFNTTIYWSDEELEEIKECMTYHLTKLMRNQILSDWNTIHSPIIEKFPNLFPNVNIETYKWALSIIYSRAIGLTRSGVYCRCIPPVLDMANHYPFKTTHLDETLAYEANEDNIVLLSNHKVSKNEQIYALYGPYPNAKLAFNYGFVIVKNPYRAIDLWTRVPPTSFEANRKTDILSSHALTKVQTYDFSGTLREGYISPALLATLRIIQINSEEEFARAENAFRGRIISYRNELTAYTSLRCLLVNRLHPERVEVTAGQEL